MAKRQIEIFIAGCPLCDETVKLVKELTCDNCEVQIYDLRQGCATNECLDKAALYGIHRVPAVAVDGNLVECCEKQTPISRETLVAAGIGQR
ncbi:glutaredoxin [Microaerobacter geothermalis]|uniref:glutaredoxin n=1 Tax=Microaerobacter geothermalis TaxID=674972 RepID=UPI001F450437|nr:glutaredoxin [Microaerobacter geothermalis]MCF6092798.1 glutaredoxin [Microaerobacter geothermalis]